jgi:branched-chain amino acid transport system substrate-binding protein
LEEIMTGDMTRRPAADVLAAVSCRLAGAAAQAQNSVKLGYAISKTGPNTGGASMRCR